MIAVEFAVIVIVILIDIVHTSYNIYLLEWFGSWAKGSA